MTRAVRLLRRSVVNAWLAVGAASAVALIIVALLVAQRMHQLRETTGPLSDAAHRHLSRLAAEVVASSTSEELYVRTVDERFAASTAQHAAKATESMNRLSVVMHQLGPTAEERFRDLQYAFADWKTALPGPKHPGGISASGAVIKHDLLSNLLESAANVTAAVIAVEQERRRSAEALQTHGLEGVVALSVLGAMSLIAVTTLGRALRRTLVDERLARSTAEAAVHTRDEILSIVSHDLRSPLTTISLSAQVLQPGSADDAETIETIRRSCGRMQRLIEDLLEVAMIERGNLSLNLTNVRPSELLAEACRTNQPIADHRNVRLECSLGDRLPSIDGDPDRLMQVLNNLLGNALKFTPPGGTIRFEAAHVSSSVRISVADSGPGIAEHDLPHLFEPYWQSKKTAHLGAGLGLKIVKGIVDAHGGRVGVDNAREGGACFWFTLPAC